MPRRERSDRCADRTARRAPRPPNPGSILQPISSSLKALLDDETKQAPGTLRASERRAAEHPFQLRRDRLRRNRPCLHVRSIIWTPTVARSLKRDVRNVTASSVTRSYFHGSHLTRHCATASIARRGQLELVLRSVHAYRD